MIRILYSRRDDHLPKGMSISEIPQALDDKTGLLWLDIVAEPPEVCEPILCGPFGFHPLAVEDALHEAHVPKLDDWGDYLYLVLHAVAFDEGTDRGVTTLELDAFIGRNFLVTHQHKPIAGTDRLWSRCQRDERYWKTGPARLFHWLADELVQDSMPVIEELDDRLETIEEQIFGSPTHATLEQILKLKRAVFSLRRAIAPERDVLNKLARDDFPVVEPEARIYFRDVYDRLVRLHDVNEGIRDQATGNLDTYLSAMSNRMNEVMKTLTVITTVFMPISFLAGFFGMNFFQPMQDMTRWTSTPAFALVLLAVILVPLGMFLWVRRRGWM